MAEARKRTCKQVCLRLDEAYMYMFVYLSMIFVLLSVITALPLCFTVFVLSYPAFEVGHRYIHIGKSCFFSLRKSIERVGRSLLARFIDHDRRFADCGRGVARAGARKCGLLRKSIERVGWSLQVRFANCDRRVTDCGRGVVMAIARKCASTTTCHVYCRDVDNSGNGNGELFQLIKFENRTFWTNEEVKNERLKVGSLLTYQRFAPSFQTVSEQGKLVGKQFITTTGGKPQDMDKLLLDLQGDESVHRGLKKAHGYVNLKVHKFQAFLEKLYAKLHKACTRAYLIGIWAGTIWNERVTLETVDGELLDMPLNCRENLVLSTAPVQLQLKRPWEVSSNDVGGVAVVKFEAYKFTCEGLILRYKPLVISRDEEPVEIQNGCGEVVPVPGHHRVLFDTGNEVATAISRVLLGKLNLQPDSSNKRKVKLGGGRVGHFDTVEIGLVIRGNYFRVYGIVDAPAEGTDLLVGMDIIQKLFDVGYTIGN